MTAAAVFFIGVAPFHDLLILGHEGTHRMISRHRVLNELAGGFALALAGISNTAHRAFHLKHHRQPHTAADPEFQLFERVAPGVPGWAYLLIPAAAAAGIDHYGLRHRRLRAAVARELLAVALLHAALAWALGGWGYLLFVIAPGFTGLFCATVLRSICEHHAVPEGGAWENARSVATGRVVEFFWSNVNYHLEHHLYPGVPYHRLPELRRLLRPEQ
jgi:fatty acid desaturase